MSFLAQLNWTKPVVEAPYLPSVDKGADGFSQSLGRDERFALPMRPSGLNLPAFVPAPPPVAPGAFDAF